MLFGGMVPSRRFPPILAILATLAPLTALADAPLYQWVQYAPGGVEARAIMDGAATCPAIQIDGKAAPMKPRSTPGPDYPITVCAAPIPAGAKAAMIAQKPLPLPRPRPDRILLIGDTGCRVSKSGSQACNDEGSWPFPKGSVVEAGLRPDVVLHMGDFHYREAACPLDNKGCAGSPFGDTWAVWKADFFEPAKPLLEIAPFVFTRGNHEECERGGKGWSRTLDPYAVVSESGCLGLGAPFLADLGDPKVVVLDVSTAPELRASKTQVPFYRQEFRDVAKIAPTGPVWLAFHRPIWASGVSVFGFIVGDNKTLAEAARDDIPANVDMLLSGHIHTFQILSYKEDLPTGMIINGVTVESGRGTPGVFGFVVLDREPGGWKATNYDMSANVLTLCHLKGRKMACD
jgi:hypothetical protein